MKSDVLIPLVCPSCHHSEEVHDYDQGCQSSFCQCMLNVEGILRTLHSPILSCLRCSHSWLRRSLTSEPKFCPRCHSPYWNRQRKAKISAKD
jgi:hypothetical protein